MKIINESEVRILDTTDPSTEIGKCVTGARLCYKSEVGDPEKDRALIKSLITRGHHAMLEHGGFSALIKTDRGVTHELVRHRLFSFAQESTRYCNYSKDKFGGEISVLCPKEIWEGSEEGNAIWSNEMISAEKAYLDLISLGYAPQVARAVLPTCLVTTILVTGNFREWRHFFELRALGRSGKPQSAMLDVASKLLKMAYEKFPVMFEDLWEEYTYKKE